MPTLSINVKDENNSEVSSDSCLLSADSKNVSKNCKTSTCNVHVRQFYNEKDSSINKCDNNEADVSLKRYNYRKHRRLLLKNSYKNESINRIK